VKSDRSMLLANGANGRDVAALSCAPVRVEGTQPNTCAALRATWPGPSRETRTHADAVRGLVPARFLVTKAPCAVALDG